MNVADLPRRVASKISVDDATGCWSWTGTLHNGYPYMRFQFGKHTHAYAHRITYGLLVDDTLPIAGANRNDQLDHVAERCANRPNCVNPAHLDRVSARENSIRYRRTAKSSSRYTGVIAFKGGWRAQIMENGCRRHLGTYETEERAADAYDAALIALGLPPVNLLNRITEVAS